MYGSDTDSLLKLVQMVCDEVVSQGADQADAWANAKKGISVDVDRSSIKSADARTTGIISIRAFYKGGSGLASTDNLDEESVLEAARSAAQLARLAEPDPDFISLPNPTSYQPVPDLYDSKVAEMEIRDVIDACLGNIEGAKQVTPDANVSGGASVMYGNWAVANSLGVRACGRNSSIAIDTMVIVRRGDDVGAFYDFDVARLLSDFNPHGLGKSAAEMALKFLGARKVKTEMLPIVLGPLAGVAIIDGIAGSASAEGVQRNRSFLIGKKGQKIASDLLTIVDDPLIPGGLNSRECDLEGVPSRRTVLMKDGVLCSYLHNSYTSHKAGECNTGHSARGGISPSNLVPRLGDKTAVEIISEVDEGLYINEGGIMPDPVSGDISASVDFGFKIEKGELVYPVKSTMIGGNFIDMLKNIDAISSDYRAEPGVCMPTMRIQSVSVAGGE